MTRIRIRYTGRVQGVGFRVTSRDVARGFAVSGWVRNEDDGSVMLEVQGAREEIEAFRARLRAVMGRNISGEDSATIDANDGEVGFSIVR